MKSTAAKKKISEITESAPSLEAGNALDFIATAAYYKAEARGFMPGQELDDWLEAESEHC